VIVSVGGKRLSSCGEVRAAKSSCAAAMINAFLDAVGILMSYTGNQLSVSTTRSEDVCGNKMRWQQ